MIKKLKYLLSIHFFLFNVCVSNAVFADNVMNTNQMLRLMASHQASYEYCKAKYPQQMTARFGQETDAFEALAKIHSFDQSSETFLRKMIHDQQDEFNKNKKIISKEIAAQTPIDDSDLCFWFVVQKTGTMAQVNQIVYDPQQFKFYLSINGHWFEGDIDGYGLTDCSCNEQNETSKDDEKEKIKHTEKLKAFIQKAKLEMGKGTSFYMSHSNENERQAYIRVSTVIENKGDTTSDQGENNDLGLEFRDIQPIQSPPANVEYVNFFDMTGELYYECKINYINSSLTTCFKELIK